ncbi:MAG TPA: hypothetical protein VGR35_08735 [Tepidisphaeraceae bacterium]|nr:hypothetical protein [Tepidisphaeraceae bacterium]
MSRLVKWSLPILAFAVVVSLVTLRALGQEGAAANGKVTGTIQNEDDTPAANVTVRLVVPPTKGEKERKKEAPKPQAVDPEATKAADEQKPAKKPERPKPVAETRTDAEGKFELEAPAGKYTIMANLRGAGRVQKTIEIKAGETKDVGTLTLKKPAGKKEAAPAT